MEQLVKTRVSEILKQNDFPEKDAHFITEVMDGIDKGQQQRFEQSKDVFLTQKDKTELIDRINGTKTVLSEKINETRSQLLEKIAETKIELIDRINDGENRLTKSIFIAGIVQFLAIIAALLAIINFGLLHLK